MQTTGPEPANPENTQPFAFQQGLPAPHSAASWRPDGADGSAQVAVPKPILLTINAVGERVEFPQGVYVVPRYIKFVRTEWNAQDNTMTQIEARLAVAGDYDEPKGPTDGACMHPFLWRMGVRRSGAQPAEEQPVEDEPEPEHDLEPERPIHRGPGRPPTRR